MASIALNNLVHDKIRFVVTLAGIAFAVFLIIVQLGVFFGFLATSSNIIDRSGADLWISCKGLPYVEVGSAFTERKLYKVLATPGVARAEKHIVRFSRVKLPNGGEQGVIIVGLNPDLGLGGPPELVAGQMNDLKLPDSVFIDEFYRSKLGINRLGDTLEIQNRRARVVGFTRGIRSFTTSPFVFTSFKNALNYVPFLNDNETIYILVKASPGIEIESLKRRLAATISDVDVYTNDEFSWKTRRHFMFTTGAGTSLLVTAFMGLIVGVVIVALTIYQTTIDHLREYGTLKAIGASNLYIYKVIIKQAVISAIFGYLLGLVFSFTLIDLIRKGGPPIVLPWQLIIGMLGVTLLMCISASFISINKVTRIDPVMVFKD